MRMVLADALQRQPQAVDETLKRGEGSKKKQPAGGPE
jgi:hypothetical protein